MSIFTATLLILLCMTAWLFHKRSMSPAATPAERAFRLHGEGRYEFPVVGVARHRTALERICASLQPEARTVDALLVLEDAGSSDRKMVRIAVQGLTVGYLPAELAEAYRRRLAESGHPEARSVCKARITVRTHGITGPEYAVRLDLPQKGAGNG
jgi:hypothetical protein